MSARDRDMIHVAIAYELHQYSDSVRSDMMYCRPVHKLFAGACQHRERIKRVGEVRLRRWYLRVFVYEQ